MLSRQFTPLFVAQHRAAGNSQKKIVVSAIRSSSNRAAPKPGGFFDNISDSLSYFRLRAVNALTSSLPEEERSELLNKLQPKLDEKDKEDNTVPQRSIDEAVAAARAQEATLHVQKWEKEKEKLMKEAEDAARARVENDIAIQRRVLAFEAWKRDLEQQKNGTSKPTEEKIGAHPILGPALVDLGHKKIHIADIKDLASIPVWKKQRIYRHERAKNMASDKLKTLHLGLPGIIGIFEAKDGSLSIIDGQHRLGMLRVLQEGNVETSDFDFGRILVEVYPQRDDLDETTHAKEIFLEVNKAEPVKLVDLPGVAKARDRNVINEGANLLQERFPDMFSPSQRCRAPHLNIDNLRDALFASNVIEKHSLKSAKALESWLMAQNEILSAKFQDKEAQKLVSAAALKKAIKFDFYLGLDSSWLYN